MIFVSDSTMESSPKSLQETCMVVVIKQGLSKERLPEILKEEVEQFERRIMSAFTGKFFTYERCGPRNGSVEVGLSVVWNRGRLEFAFIAPEFAMSSNEELLQIKAGEKNKVGKVGSKLFLLPGKELTIFDYKIELKRKKLSLLGSCLSIFDERALPLKIVLSFYRDISPPSPFNFTLEIESKVWEKGYEGVDPLCEKKFSFIELCYLPVPAVSYDEGAESNASRESDAESSDAPDSEPGSNESDSDSNDDGERRRNDNDD